MVSHSTGTSPNAGAKLLGGGRDVYNDFTELPFRHCQLEPICPFQFLFVDKASTALTTLHGFYSDL